MADLLARMEEYPRYKDRTQAAFVRSLKFLNAGRAGGSPVSSDRLPGFNIKTILRIRDLNPSIYVCAMTLLDENVEEDPAAIRESGQFRNLIDKLQLQTSSSSRDVTNTHRASLILLEVFTYMVLINRAREDQDKIAAANRVASGEGRYVEEDLV